MKKKNHDTGNYLDKIPVRSPELSWSKDEQGNVVIDMENKGMVNRIAQKLIKKPKVSHIHLDEMGSFVWPLIDGQTTIFTIGKSVEEHFGEKAQPLYERLAQFFRILENNGFISVGVQSPTEIKASGGLQECADENVSKADAHSAARTRKRS